MARRRARTVVATVLGVLVVVAAVAVPVALRMRQDRVGAAARAAVDGFARAWPTGTLAAVHYAGTPGATVATQVSALTAGLAPALGWRCATPRRRRRRRRGRPRGRRRPRGRLKVHWALTGGRSWTYTTAVDARDGQGGWGVVWSPTVVHPALTADRRLVATRTTGHRGRILGARGEVLAGEREVVNVGVEPRRTTDAAGTAAAVAGLVDVDAAALARSIKAAAPTAFVPVITLRAEAYRPLAGRLQAVAGVVTTRSTLAIGRTATFARVLIGSVGPATKEIVAASNGRVRTGDLTGLAGLQRTYDRQLSGTAGLVVSTAPAAKAAAAGSSAPAPPPLFTAPATDGADVTTTLDPTLQDAAEAALAASPKPAGLVAVRVSTGDVLAVANGGAPGVGRLRPRAARPVPARVDLQGRQRVRPAPAGLHGDHAGGLPRQGRRQRPHVRQRRGRGAGHGALPHRLRAVVQHGLRRQCVEGERPAGGGSGGGARLRAPRRARRPGVRRLGARLGDARGARRRHDRPGEGSREPADGRHGVGVGRGRQDRLAEAGGPARAGGSGADGRCSSSTPGPLPRCGSSCAPSSPRAPGRRSGACPAAPVFGKTGTAEFGTKNPPDTHAWFTGYQGDVAFAVVVEGGGFGAKAAAPLAADFLRRLPR